MNLFKYPLRINRDKHPEVCKVLEKKKEKDGIALYLRKLIEQDIENSKFKAGTLAKIESAASDESWYTEQQEKQPEPVKQPRITFQPKEDDDFGGGLL